jgi:hypothetical protein
MARYFDAAAMSNDPVERMKLVMTSSIAFLESCHTWAKPLNPILGETYQATLQNGAVLSVEQVSHHPPVTYLLLDGPEQHYRYYGYSSFSVKAYINSINLDVDGYKVIEFKDGSSIRFNNHQDTFGNTLIGTLNHVLHGKITFTDSVNNVVGHLDIGNVRRMPRDYFTGHIEQDG